MDYRMEELIPIVADLAKQYAGCDSTNTGIQSQTIYVSGIFPLWNNIRQVHSLCWKK